MGLTELPHIASEHRQRAGHLSIVEACSLYCKVGRIEFSREMHLIISHPYGHDHISRCMGLREHVLYLVTGLYVPFRHLMGPHLCTPLLMLRILGEFAFTHGLHDGEGKAGFQALGYKGIHYIVSVTDSSLYGAYTALYQVPRIAYPHICSVGQSGNADKV